ncbi:hypothetical protein [Flammeovirga sp. SubArs3]|uniref:hypothetical protein n=1 Tax=Flammeovirga sp. SubArs3 TaxID=2995316 RepID=UPI00248B414A|nr:hypothetical protein [Flammeovirga sp. SubArs3]
MKVQNYAELMVALDTPSIQQITITDTIYVPQSIRLPKGLILEGINKEQSGLFFGDGDGIGLTESNTVQNLTVQVSPVNRALFISSIHENLGKVTLQNLNVTGQIQLITRETTQQLQLKINAIDIVSADVRQRKETQSYFGVEVVQGALTVFNFCTDNKSEIQLEIDGISIGRKEAPVLGSGVLISGYGITGGKVVADLINTNAIYSNGMLPLGVNNIISGSLFIMAGVEVEQIVNSKELVTYGVNGMVLDNWGKVSNWIAKDNIISYGPSGIGFVNFGVVENFVSKRKIETFGLGARGFNQYEGTIDKAQFNEIITHGDGAIGIQVSKPVGEIRIDKSLTTLGSKGKTLVKGQIFELSADGISVLPKGTIQKLHIEEGIRTEGNGVVSLKVAGKVHDYSNNGEVLANGRDAKTIVIEDSGEIKNM